MKPSFQRRPPTPSDIVLLAKALSDNGVEYVVIGGAAMALHGFPRMTKDIDLFLPVDRSNNRRLLRALSAIPHSDSALAELRPRYLDEGYSTSFEGEILVDLLYVAADRKYEDLQSHIRRIDLDGVPVCTLDVDGMLLSKQTTRASDVPDRIKLERLRNRLYEMERERRVAAIPALHAHGSAAVRFFAREAELAIVGAGEQAVRWKNLEERVLAAASQEPSLNLQEVCDALCGYSPGAVYPNRRAELQEMVKTFRKHRRAPRPRRS